MMKTLSFKHHTVRRLILVWPKRKKKGHHSLTPASPVSCMSICVCAFPLWLTTCPALAQESVVHAAGIALLRLRQVPEISSRGRGSELLSSTMIPQMIVGLTHERMG